MIMSIFDFMKKEKDSTTSTTGAKKKLNWYDRRIERRMKKIEKIDKEFQESLKKMGEVAEATRKIYREVDENIDKAMEEIKKEKEEAEKKANSEKKDSTQNHSEQPSQQQTNPQAAAQQPTNQTVQNPQQTVVQQQSNPTSVTNSPSADDKKDDDAKNDEDPPLDPNRQVMVAFDYFYEKPEKKVDENTAAKLQQQDFSMWQALNSPNNDQPINTMQPKPQSDNVASSTLKDGEKPQDNAIVVNPQDVVVTPAINIGNPVVPEAQAAPAPVIDPNTIFNTMTDAFKNMATGVGKEIPDVLKNDHYRFKVPDPYNEEKFLHGILDDIILKEPGFSYEIQKIEGDSEFAKRYYNLCVTGGSGTLNVRLDPRYTMGLGVPLVYVLVTNGMGRTEYQWVPLGAKFLMGFVLFKNKQVEGPYPQASMIPMINAIKVSREMWPPVLYNNVDMSNFYIESGADYQALGFWIFQTLMSVSNAFGNPKLGRYRISKYTSPLQWELISDESVLPLVFPEPGTQGYQAYEKEQLNNILQIKINFDNGRIMLTSLTNGYSWNVACMQFPYPMAGWVEPLCHDENTFFKEVDAIEAPKPLSEFEKISKSVSADIYSGEGNFGDPLAYLPVQQQQIPTVGQMMGQSQHQQQQSTDPNAPVDMNAIFNNLTRVDGSVNVDAIKAQYGGIV